MRSSKAAEDIEPMPRVPSPEPPSSSRQAEDDGMVIGGADALDLRQASSLPPAESPSSPSSTPPDGAKPRARRTRRKDSDPATSEPPKPRKSSTPRARKSSLPAAPKSSAPKTKRTSRQPRSDAPARELPPHLYAEVMPYFPSAPCATCATGVDPLRAACVRATERGWEYFCSRDCREAHQRTESERALRRSLEAASIVVGEARSAPAAPRAPIVSAAPPRIAPRSLEPVARRIAPGRATTPSWPLVIGGFGAALSFAPFAFAPQAGAVLLLCTAAAFASQCAASREQAGTVGWLAPPLAVAAFTLAVVLEPARFALAMAAAAGALLVAWTREHWLERAQATLAAVRAELEARLPPRARLWMQGEANARAEPRTSERPLSSLRVGDQILVDTGSVVPVDGVVEEGTAEVLPYPQARMTYPRAPGAAVLAGALVVHGSVRVRATAVGTRRAMFRALSLSDEQLEHGSSSAHAARRARTLAPGALGLVLALIVAIASAPSAASTLMQAGAALLALPLLALARGALAALQHAVVEAARLGVFYRDGEALERTGDVDTAVLRVEGTLVTPSYTLVEIQALGSETREQLLAWALAAESIADAHPIARAVRKHAASFAIEPANLRRLSYARGAGVSGGTDGQGALVFGSRTALLQAGVSVAVADREAQRAEQDGQKVVLLAVGGHVRGLFVFAQEVRAEARSAVQSLFDLGLEVELVSGDHRNTVEALARTLDVMQIKAELSRDQREAEVRRLRDGDARVVAIGRAGDAAGMLTAADVGLCLEGAPDVHAPGDLRAIAYDVTTASLDLRDAAHALSTARLARRMLRRVWALAGCGALVVLLGASGSLPAWACALLALAIDFSALRPASLVRTPSP